MKLLLLKSKKKSYMNMRFEDPVIKDGLQTKGTSVSLIELTGSVEHLMISVLIPLDLTYAITYFGFGTYDSKIIP